MYCNILLHQVKYEITGRGKAARYFDVNHDTGEVSIKDDLRKEMDTEYHVWETMIIQSTAQSFIL